MPSDTDRTCADDYGAALAEYIRTRSEEALYRASLVSKAFVEGGLGPEDVVALHFESLDRVLRTRSLREQARASIDAHQFLLEVMIAYGVRYKEYLELRLSEAQHDAELRMARTRERALEAERIQRERSELLAMVAHELRAPITVARGHLDIARTLLTRGQVDPVPDHLGTAREALDRLSRLTADLVEASRGEPPDLTMSQIDLPATVAQACLWAQPTALNKGIALVYQTDDNSVIPILGNADALLSVLGNLLSNAIRYTPPGGQVTVRWGNEDDQAWFSVQDTGIGMSPDVSKRIFERFYRSAEARKVEARGLGLGLTLVDQFVRAHGGRIVVRSEPGEGSEFRVFLPRGLDRSQEEGDGKPTESG